MDPVHSVFVLLAYGLGLQYCNYVFTSMMMLGYWTGLTPSFSGSPCILRAKAWSLVPVRKDCLVTGNSDADPYTYIHGLSARGVRDHNRLFLGIFGN